MSTAARACTRTFAGIRLGDTAPFVAAQFAGAVAATWLMVWLAPAREVA
jgi:hypothetical protein